MKQALLIAPFEDLYGEGSGAGLDSFGNVDELLDGLAAVAEAAFGFSTVTREIPAGSLPLPVSAFSRRRGQYDASGLLEELVRRKSARKTEEETLLLGVTAADLFAPRLNYVFGLADRDSGTAVISLCRLAPEFYGEKPDLELLKVRAGKEAVHELGHLFGLSHCANAGCIMRFSSTIAETDAKGPGFCASCEPAVFR